MGYCTKCGAPRVAGGAFCTVCGAALPVMDAAPAATVANVSAPPVAPPLTPPVAARGGSGLRTFAIVAVVVLLLAIGLGIAAAFYAVRAAKNKAEGLLHSIAPSVASSSSAPATGKPP